MSTNTDKYPIIIFSTAHRVTSRKHMAHFKQEILELKIIYELKLATASIFGHWCILYKAKELNSQTT